jgi:hypothetical protein
MRDDMTAIGISVETELELEQAMKAIEERVGTKQTMDSAIRELIAVYYRTPVAYKERKR